MSNGILRPLPVLYFKQMLFINFYSAWRSCEFNKVMKSFKDFSFQSHSVLLLIFLCQQFYLFYRIEKVFACSSIFYPQQGANSQCDSSIKKANFTLKYSVLLFSYIPPFPLAVFFCNFDNASLEQHTQTHSLNFCAGLQVTFFSSRLCQSSGIYLSCTFTWGTHLEYL